VAGAVVGAGATASVAPAAPPPGEPIDLCAKPGTLALPAGGSVTVWGFARPGAGETCADVAASVPGPVLDLAQGHRYTITLHNGLDEAVSLEIPGQTIDEGPVEAAAHGSADYTFTASAPGTFLYQSAANAGRQLAMGLYGALLVRPPVDGRAYGTADSAFAVERTLVLSAIDPALNADPDGFDMRRWAPTYWLINGRSYPDVPEIAAGSGQRLLLRYLNAGFDNTTMALLGTYERVIARDAYLLGNPHDAVAETLPAGQTMDAVVTLPSAGRFPLYNRQLHLSNGPGKLGDPGFWPGGMMTFIAGS
jgi:FtsP/CotA-like multicopper oxidase with cupredoxin domain